MPAALTLATFEAARRQDARTLSCLAWAHQRAGQLDAARTAIARAVALGANRSCSCARR